MADILYVYKTSIYANLTNKCPCRCTFCIRNNTDSVGSADTLWHKHDPSMEDIKRLLMISISQATRSLYSVATANRLQLLIICLKPQNMWGKAPRHQTQTQHKRSFWQNQQQAHSWVDFKVYWFCFNQPQYLFIGKVWRSLPSCFWPCVWVNAQICRGC